MIERSFRDESPGPGASDLRSRRSILATAGALGIAATAGCLDTAMNATSQRIEPTEPSEPREGTPEEFYYFLEQNGIDVGSLYRSGNDLELTYASSAETVDESNEEIGIIYQIFSQALVLRGSDIETLLAEIDDPIDGQPRGWGLSAEWIEQLEAGEVDEGALWGAIVDSMVFDDDAEVDRQESDAEPLDGSAGDADVENDGDGDEAEEEKEDA